MDLTVETKDYVFSLDKHDLVAVDLFIMHKLHKKIDFGNVIYMSKKEVMKLIEYMKENQEKYGVTNSILDRFISMEMLMQGKEKAEFRYY